MPLEPHEELKLSWELKLMEVQVDQALFDREKLRQDINESQMRVEKALADIRMDEKRFKIQVWTTLIGGLGAIVAGFTAWVTWWSHVHN